MPQDCAKWEHNQIYSNNEDLFNAERDAYCKNTPIRERDPKIVCPTFQVPVGTGHRHLRRQRRHRPRQLHLRQLARRASSCSTCRPRSAGDDPDKAIDTSFDNTFTDNKMGVRPDGTRDAERQRLLVGRGGHAATAGAATSARAAPSRPANVVDRPARLPGLERPERPATRPRPPARPRARRGIRSRTRTRRAATGSPDRRSRSQ